MATERDVYAPNLSVGWVLALRALRRMRVSRTTNLIVRVADPAVEIPELRALADGLVAAAGLQQVRTVPAPSFLPLGRGATRSPRLSPITIARCTRASNVRPARTVTAPISVA